MQTDLLPHQSFCHGGLVLPRQVLFQSQDHTVGSNGGQDHVLKRCKSQKVKERTFSTGFSTVFVKSSRETWQAVLCKLKHTEWLMGDDWSVGELRLNSYSLVLEAICYRDFCNHGNLLLEVHFMKRERKKNYRLAKERQILTGLSTQTKKHCILCQDRSSVYHDIPSSCLLYMKFSTFVTQGHQSMFLWNLNTSTNKIRLWKSDHKLD